MKTNGKVGDEWLGSTNGTDRYYMKIVAKNIDYKVDSVTYHNVIKMYQTKVGTSNDTALRSNLFFAAGIGLVHITGDLEVKLISANIK